MSEDDVQDADGRQIQKTIIKHAGKGELACKQAFKAADALGVSPDVIGRYADEMGLKLVACQLGLFGYKPEKKIVQPLEPVSPALESEIAKNLVDGRLPCAAAFTIAEKTGMKKMDVSGACEALNIRIKPCQLGAF